MFIYGSRHEVFPKFLTDIKEGDINWIIRYIREIMSAPNTGYEIFSCQYLFLMRKKCLNDETFVFREMHRYVPDFRFLCRCVESDIPIFYNRLVHTVWRASEDCLDSCNKHVRNEWFGKIIISTDTEPIDDLLTVATSRYDNNRGTAMLTFPKPTHNIKPHTVPKRKIYDIEFGISVSMAHKILIPMESAGRKSVILQFF